MGVDLGPNAIAPNFVDGVATVKAPKKVVAAPDALETMEVLLMSLLVPSFKFYII